MRYGIEHESKAIEQYAQLYDVSVKKCGLWINQNYTHLGASPDGLVFNDNVLDGIVEVKCLKILKLQSVEELLQNPLTAAIKTQCFTLRDSKLVLKRTHAYYYQIQLQLLITEAKYCDLVLFSAKGLPSIERITPDIKLQHRIVESTKRFWKKVLVPEYFIMRVPRELIPIIF